MLNLPPLPICGICSKPVSPETSKADENGKIVHEGCYLLSVRRKPPLDAKPSQRTG